MLNRGFSYTGFVLLYVLYTGFVLYIGFVLLIAVMRVTRVTFTRVTFIVTNLFWS
jgi:hypothetical protein